MDLPDEMDEKLRECSCIGDVDAVSLLLSQGANVNSHNKMNGWTALHWAAKRNHSVIVQSLLKANADKFAKNMKGEMPSDLTTNEAIWQMLSENDSSNEKVKDEGHVKFNPSNFQESGLVKFVPNYLANPSFPYFNPSTNPNRTSSDIRADSDIGAPEQIKFSNRDQEEHVCRTFQAKVGANDSIRVDDSRSNTASNMADPGMTNDSIRVDDSRSNTASNMADPGMTSKIEQNIYRPFAHVPPSRSKELVFKVREAGSSETDFIEVELSPDHLSYENLLNVCCTELSLTIDSVIKIRKLPNTKLRKDKDVLRLNMYQELEVVCKHVQQ